MTHLKLRPRLARTVILFFALAAPTAQAQPDPPSLSSLEYVWAVAADSTDACPRLPDPWRADCSRAADGLRTLVLACTDSSRRGQVCLQRTRDAAELGDALKLAVLAIDGNNAICSVRKIPPGRCTELEHSQKQLASIAAQILQLTKNL
jgi:hypothetical protein